MLTANKSGFSALHQQISQSHIGPNLSDFTLSDTKEWLLLPENNYLLPTLVTDEGQNEFIPDLWNDGLFLL